jgi:hypothetical protein
MREGPGAGLEGVREELTVTPSLAIPGAVPNLSKSAIAKALSTHVDFLVEGVVPGVAAMFRDLAELVCFSFGREGQVKADWLCSIRSIQHARGKHSITIGKGESADSKDTLNDGTANHLIL